MENSYTEDFNYNESYSFVENPLYSPNSLKKEEFTEKFKIKKIIDFNKLLNQNNISDTSYNFSVSFSLIDKENTIDSEMFKKEDFFRDDNFEEFQKNYYSENHIFFLYRRVKILNENLNFSKSFDEGKKNNNNDISFNTRLFLEQNEGNKNNFYIYDKFENKKYLKNKSNINDKKK